MRPSKTIDHFCAEIGRVAVPASVLFWFASGTPGRGAGLGSGYPSPVWSPAITDPERPRRPHNQRPLVHQAGYESPPPRSPPPDLGKGLGERAPSPVGACARGPSASLTPPHPMACPQTEDERRRAVARRTRRRPARRNPNLIN